MSYSINLSDEVFEKLAVLIREKAGIRLNTSKKELVRARLSKIIREEGFESFQNYYDYVLHDRTGQELIRLLDSISTNLTEFFRESGHFDYMTDVFIPDILESDLHQKSRRLRIWSAGCSTGEEPYSIAIVLEESFPPIKNWDVKVLATDISTEVLQTAIRGFYNYKRVEGISKPILKKYFQRGSGQSEDLVKVKDQIKKLITFRYLNFVDKLPFAQKFDLIFCRNVMIYFDKPFQKELVERFYQVLNPGGYLFIGHAESINWPGSKFKYIRPTVYKK